MFSLELHENTSEIRKYAFYNCQCLRNVALPPNAVFGDDDIFIVTLMGTTIISDLYQLFGSESRIIFALRHRFDGLPIHSIVYYQSYHQGVLQNLITAIDSRSDQLRTTKLDPTGSQQDCLGMTPLHILTCSSVHNIEVYRLIIEKYPTNLITEDGWGALPLLYAFWGAAPAAIIQFLVYSYQSLYPDHVFNWTNMVWTMGRCDTPKESIENLLLVKQMHFPDQPIDWEYLIDEFASSSSPFSWPGPFKERLQFLVMCGVSARVEALAFTVWRDFITNMIHTANFECNGDNSNVLHRIREKLAHFEAEYPKLKEITTILELTVWKLRMNEMLLPEKATQCQKKMKTDELSRRRQCRITCGADVVIRHVLPYLIAVVN